MIDLKSVLQEGEEFKQKLWYWIEMHPMSERPTRDLKDKMNDLLDSMDEYFQGDEV